MPSGPAAALRFYARWDRDRAAFAQALSERAGRPVRFAERAVPTGAAALYGLFDRDPLGAVVEVGDAWSLPYDPWSAWRAVVEERWLPVRAPAHARFAWPYHLVPGALRMALYPLVAGRAGDPEASPPDPAWPIERRVDDFRRALFEGITPRSAAAHTWPGGAYPLLVTLDVDTAEGMKVAPRVLDALVRIGVKPCFFLVGRGYRWDEGFCDAVRQAGGEIGLHGDTHDNRIAFVSSDVAGQRLDRCRSLIEHHGIHGFRSPSLLVSDALYEAVAPRFAWDSSVPDTDTNTLLGPRRGCGTIFPFRRAGTLVLPTTMPADDRLLLLGRRGLTMLDTWRRKWAHVRAASGLCHFLVHPEPHLLGQPVVLDLFCALLQEITAEGDAWVTTPSEVARFWRSLEDDPT